MLRSLRFVGSSPIAEVALVENNGSIGCRKDSGDGCITKALNVGILQDEATTKRSAVADAVRRRALGMMERVIRLRILSRLAI